MSASLVGSEMCIRDRAPAELPETSALRRGGAPPRAPRAPHAGSLRRRAVSYTHLTLPTICSV
eukprot:15321886-Alexandrium_andersonii.AAC.1